MQRTGIRMVILGVFMSSAIALATPVASVAPRATPVLGWNAWNTFSTDGKPMRGGRKEYETVVEAMLESGMVEAGYTLMSTVCTGWTGRDPVTHELQQNLTNWPGGMQSFSDYLHTKGMTLSVYTDAGVKNCCQEPGSLGFEDIDMKTFASWGVDAVGVDYCGGPADVQGAFEKFATGIEKSGRAMQLGIWNMGRGAAYKWAPAMSVNMSAATQQVPGVFRGAWAPHIRLTRDIGNVWDGTGGPTESVMALVDQIQAIPDLWDYGLGNRSGTFPNYGQMVVGVPPGHPSSPDVGLTLVEAQSHFSLWAMFGSLMFATNDVRKRDKSIEAILMNRETIAVNQDPWTVPAFRIPNKNCSGMQWARHLANGDIAALVLNRNSKNGDPATHARVDFADVVPSGSAMAYHVRDIQANKDLGVACSSVSFVLQPHETAFVRLTPAGPCKAPAHPPACTAPRPPPPGPPPPMPPGPPQVPPKCFNGKCRGCGNAATPCPFPLPPLPPCPAGYTPHASGYWADADQKAPSGHSWTVAQCATYCTTTLKHCTAFEVYDPNQVTEPSTAGGSACYTFSNGLASFVADKRGLIRTCVKA